MDSILDTFTQTNAARSQSIYNAFNSGGVINKKDYSTSKAEFTETSNYREIIVNLHHYRQLYWHLGYHLEQDDDGEYFYLKSISEDNFSDENFDETSLKLMAILTIVSRMANRFGQPISTLSKSEQGISGSDLDLLDKDSEVSSMFKSLKIKDAKDAIKFLLKRGFAFRVDNSRYVLSKGAQEMIMTIIERHKVNTEDDLVLE